MLYLRCDWFYQVLKVLFEGPSSCSWSQILVLYYMRQQVDFGLLFPEMACFVVHGGLGTTVEALRTGSIAAGLSAEGKLSTI